MKIQCRYDKLVPIGELKAYPKNRNSHSPEQIERLAKLLAHHSVRAPVIVSNRSGYIMKGHGTVQAFSHNRWGEVPVVFQDFEDEDAEYLFVQSDNAIASWSELDLSGINLDLQDIGPFDIELLGIENFSVTPIEKLEPQCDEDEVPEVQESFVKLGDIWQLGRHRLMCGDSTSIDAVEKLMNGQKTEICFTSPPYNAAATPGGLEYSRHRKYLNWKQDAKSEDDYCEFLSGFLQNAIMVSKLQLINLQMLEGGKRSIIKWLGINCNHYLDQLVWIKPNAAPTPPETITPKHEMIFIFSEEVNPNKRIPTAQFKHFFSVVENEGAQKNEESAKHKATFPVSLASHIIESFSSNSSAIYEPFGGSGSTLIACEKTNRRCFMMELDPHYCAVIVERWQKFTGKKAERITHGEES